MANYALRKYRFPIETHGLSDLGIDEITKNDALDISAAIRNRLTFNRMRRLIVE